MALPDSYLEYADRRYGTDHTRFSWPGSRTPAFSGWPGGRPLACAIVVPLEFHMLNPSGKPFKHPGAMVTPYPDLRHFTTRDYGTRVGVFRILRELGRHRLKATFPINAALLSRAAPLVEAIGAGGHEAAAYGVDTDHIHWGGLEVETERHWISEVRSAFAVNSLSPTTWMSPARQQSFHTLDLLAEAGFTTCLDWESDSVPLAMKTKTGTILAVPIANELDDRILMIDRHQSEEDWADQIIAALTYMLAEAKPNEPQVLGFTLTPYVAGQPFRIKALRRLLAWIAAEPSIFVAPAGTIAAEFAAAVTSPPVGA